MNMDKQKRQVTGLSKMTVERVAPRGKSLTLASLYRHRRTPHAVRNRPINLPGRIKFRFRKQVFAVGVSEGRPTQVSVGPPHCACSGGEAENGRTGEWPDAAAGRLALPVALRGRRPRSPPTSWRLSHVHLAPFSPPKKPAHLHKSPPTPACTTLSHFPCW